MPIQFICPNGHPLAAPTKQAGKPGRCPKCDVAYVTPAADERAADDAPATAKGADDTAQKQVAGEESFQFLCPNGHKINTPVRLAGELGQCPRCGERFHIPETGLPIEEGQQEQAGGGASDGSHEDSQTVTPVIPLGAARNGWTVPVSALSGEQTIAEAITWIWEEKGPEQQVEITLRDGTVIRPTAYAGALTSKEVGIFGTTDPATGMTLQAIAWDAVAHVAVTNLADEVDDLFAD